MKWSKLIAMLMLMSVVIIASGCNWYRKEFVLEPPKDGKPGQSIEIYGRHKLTTIGRNKETGKIERRIYYTRPGDRVYRDK